MRGARPGAWLFAAGLLVAVLLLSGAAPGRRAAPPGSAALLLNSSRTETLLTSLQQVSGQTLELLGKLGEGVGGAAGAAGGAGQQGQEGQQGQQQQQEQQDRGGGASSEELKRLKDELRGYEEDLRLAAEADARQLAGLLKAAPAILEARRQAIGGLPKRGIMVSAAWASHLANTFVNLHVLRHTLGCSLPVAVT